MRGFARVGVEFVRRVYPAPKTGVPEVGELCVEQVVDAGVGADQLPVEAAWDSIRTSLRKSCGERIFDGWLKPLKLAACDPDSGEVRLAAPSAFMATWVQNHFSEQIGAWPRLVQVVFYIVAGIVWIFPVRPLLSWMEIGRFRA